MEEILTIRLSKAEKERLKEMANEKGITLSQLILSSLKVKRRKVVKPRQELVNQAA